jgi:hypothetical protein
LPTEALAVERNRVDLAGRIPGTIAVDRETGRGTPGSANSGPMLGEIADELCHGRHVEAARDFPPLRLNWPNKPTRSPDQSAQTLSIKTP